MYRTTKVCCEEGRETGAGGGEWSDGLGGQDGCSWRVEANIRDRDLIPTGAGPLS